jgi:hypothetical protein
MSAHNTQGDDGRFVARHGHTRRRERTGTFKTWTGMIQRCTNPRAFNFRHYGGRGITVCQRWFEFEAFLADVGIRPDGTSLDRINNDGNYEPGNVRWATASEQRTNQRKGLVDLRGIRYTRLTVIGFVGRNAQRNSLWACACDCGSIVTLPEYRLKNGTTKSCGCLCRDLSAARAAKLAAIRWSCAERAER